MLLANTPQRSPQVMHYFIVTPMRLFIIKYNTWEYYNNCSLNHKVLNSVLIALYAVNFMFLLI